MIFSGKSPTLTEVVASRDLVHRGCCTRDLVRRTSEECRSFAIEERTHVEERIVKLTTGLETLTAQVAAMKIRHEHIPFGGGARDELKANNGSSTHSMFQLFGIGTHGTFVTITATTRRSASGNVPAGDRRPATNLRQQNNESGW